MCAYTNVHVSSHTRTREYNRSYSVSTSAFHPCVYPHLSISLCVVTIVRTYANSLVACSNNITCKHTSTHTLYAFLHCAHTLHSYVQICTHQAKHVHYIHIYTYTYILYTLHTYITHTHTYIYQHIYCMDSYVTHIRTCIHALCT